MLRKGQKRVLELSCLIHQYNASYYTEVAEVSDESYDLQVQELHELELLHPEYCLEDSPLLQLVENLQDALVSIPHAEPMLSLGKKHTLDSLRQWDISNKKLIANENLEYVCELKIDGLAVSLVYEDGAFVRAVTRGNGRVGDDVTANLKTLLAVPMRLPVSEPLEVRGEVYMPRSEFERLNKRRIAQGGTAFKNPRNAAAGTLRMLDASEVARRKLSFFSYSQVAGHSHSTHAKNLAALAQFGFPTNDNTKVVNSIEGAIEFCSHWEAQRHTLAYEVDGVVIKVNDLNLQTRLGNTEKSPRWAMAFKFKAEQVTSIVRSIEIGVGRTGVLTPIALLDPVELNETTVARATLHNYDQVGRLGLHLGDKVVLEKGGEIIPKIVAVLPQQRSLDAVKVTPPENCPSCDVPAVQLEGDIEWRCANLQCPAQFSEQVLHFVSRNAMDIETIGPAFVEQLIEQKMLSNISDLYHLKHEELTVLERMGDKSAAKILKGLEDSKKPALSHFIFALGIHHVGQKTARLFARHFGTLEALQEANVEDLIALDDVGPAIAESCHQFFQDAQNQELLRCLFEAGVAPIPEEVVLVPIESAFLKKTVVLTGTLSEPRSVWKQRLEDAGAKITGSVSKKTDYVLSGANPGSKVQKAQKIGVSVIDENTAKEWLADIKKES